MAILPEQSIEQQLLDKLENDYVEQKPRPYMGYSGIGHPCSRKIWYNFRIVAKRRVLKRIQRIFDRGNLEEPRIISDLKTIGIDIIEQQLEVVGPDEHILGHIDGICVNSTFFDEDILAEMKTAKKELFNNLVKLKSVKRWNAVYYGQAQSYMHKLGLSKCLFLCINKNDESYYIEIIDLDIDYAKMLDAKAMDILTTDTPPPKIGGPTWWECKFCDFKEVCHYNDTPLKNCRTCNLGTIEENGIWSCNGERELSFDEQLAGCKKQKYLPELLIDD
jgi:CRISPR/Cas system-associated exonuclease Cas4 (RecB family)